MVSAMFEMTQARAWGDSGTRKVMEQIPGRLGIGGWDAVRPAISVTIRYVLVISSKLES